MISTVKKTCSLWLNESRIPVSELTEFGFVAPVVDVDGVGPHGGILQWDDVSLDIEFRVRKTEEAGSRCTFANLSIQDQQKIRKYVDQLTRLSTGNEALEERTYDELAQGISGERTETPERSFAEAPNKRGRLKALAATLMVIGLIGLVVLAAMYMQSRSSLSVSNSALVGNFLPVNARVEGEVEEVFVTEGEYVRKGDLLLKLKNPEVETLRLESEAAYAAAQQKVGIYRSQMANYKSLLGVATEKLQLDLEVAKSELDWASNSAAAYRKRVERFQPYLNSGSISQTEFDEAQEKLLAAEAKVLACKNQVRQIEFSQKLAKEDVLIIGDRVDDEVGKIRAELEIAEAQAAELKIAAESVAQQAAQLEIRAPRDGQVYSTYRQRGEYLRVADEAIALSYSGKTWAAGQVGSWQANRVRPGQPVTIRFPSLGRSLRGTVLAVGHRALYSKGGYNADFRSTTATDVPIKVLIEDLPEDIPSGIRMEMAINTGFGVGWLDSLTGYELKQIGTPLEPQDDPPENVSGPAVVAAQTSVSDDG